MSSGREKGVEAHESHRLRALREKGGEACLVILTRVELLHAGDIEQHALEDLEGVAVAAHHEVAETEVVVDRDIRAGDLGVADLTKPSEKEEKEKERYDNHGVCKERLTRREIERNCLMKMSARKIEPSSGQCRSGRGS